MYFQNVFVRQEFVAPAVRFHFFLSFMREGPALTKEYACPTRKKVWDGPDMEEFFMPVGRLCLTFAGQ